MNKELLRSIMMLHGHTYKNLAELLHLSEQSVSAKINENGTEFKKSEIVKIIEEYHLTPEQVQSIFFA